MRRRRKSTGHYVVPCLFLALLLSDQSNAAQKDWKITFNAGKLSVQTDARPLADILQEIVRLARIRIVVHGEPGDVMAQGFSGLPIDQAIRRLIGDRGVVIKYGTEPNSGEARRLVEVRVYSHGIAQASDRMLVGASSQHQTVTKPDVVSYPYPGHAFSSARLLAMMQGRQINNENGLNIIRNLLTNNKEARVRASAATILGNVAGLEAFKKNGSVKQTIKEMLRAALADQEQGVQSAARRALKRWR